MLESILNFLFGTILLIIFWAILLIPLVPFLIFGLVILLIIFRLNKAKKIAKEERLESLTEGAIEEPRILRELTEAEVGELTSLSKNYSWYKRVTWASIPIFLLVNIFLLLTIPPIINEVVEKDPTANIGLEKIGLLIFGPLAIYLQAWLIQKSLKARPTYLDLRSPVFRVQGRVLKAKTEKKNNQAYYYFVTVRGIQFSSQFGNDLVRHFFDSFQEGDEVAVEYSPRTKHVWKIYKTTDI